MADRIILLGDEDSTEARHIIDRFAEETGIEPTEDGGTWTFELSADDHDIDVTQTLNEIDPDWPERLELGDPAATDRDGEDDEREEATDSALEDTFPASDPPAQSAPGS